MAPQVGRPQEAVSCHDACESGESTHTRKSGKSELFQGLHRVESGNDESQIVNRPYTRGKGSEVGSIKKAGLILLPSSFWGIPGKRTERFSTPSPQRFA